MVVGVTAREEDGVHDGRWPNDSRWYRDDSNRHCRPINSSGLGQWDMTDNLGYVLEFGQVLCEKKKEAMRKLALCRVWHHYRWVFVALAVGGGQTRVDELWTCIFRLIRLRQVL